jgi:hypothetical protein
MHQLMAEEIVKVCQQRVREGDHPTVPPASVEQLEGCVLELALKLEVVRANEPAIEAYKLFRKERQRREAAEEKLREMAAKEAAKQELARRLIEAEQMLEAERIIKAELFKELEEANERAWR